jgi:hypothetical protein
LSKSKPDKYVIENFIISRMEALRRIIEKLLNPPRDSGSPFPAPDSLNTTIHTFLA